MVLTDMAVLIEPDGMVGIDGKWPETFMIRLIGGNLIGGEGGMVSTVAIVSSLVDCNGRAAAISISPRCVVRSNRIKQATSVAVTTAMRRMLCEKGRTRSRHNTASYSSYMYYLYSGHLVKAFPQ